jgi:hypothetical protein
MARWADSFARLAYNPSMLGCAVECAVTNALSIHGLHFPKSSGVSPSQVIKIPATLPLTMLLPGGKPPTVINAALYVPIEFNNRCVDCIAVWFESTFVNIFAVQISNVDDSSEHSDSQSSFYTTDWEQWRDAVAPKGMSIHWGFVWLIKKAAPFVHLSGDRRIQAPARDVHTVDFRTISPEIASALSRLA